MMKDVVFTKCQDYGIGAKSFWRADLNGRTISSMCSTKKECIEEVRRYIKRHSI